CEVLILSRDESKFLEFKKNIPAKYKNKISWKKLDLTDPKTIEDCVKVNSKIDFLVNNAANHYRGENFNYDYKNIKDEFFGLLGSTILITEKILKKMRNQKSGNIINVASIWGLSAPKFKTYLEMNIAPSLMTSACKAGILHMTKYLASREAKYNITVNALSPGWFPRKGKKKRLDYINMINKDIPINRIGVLGDLIPAINFLIDEKNKYFTGQSINIDGGHSVW
ncbi:SDR family oxidoreductase, partial [Candidatus Pelagibacter sp.]|nr:SDR family oxidoreductase [Candidatus Pelagibacter sp.]